MVQTIKTLARRVRASRKRKEVDTAVDPQEVAMVAYGLFESRGYGHGSAEQDWLQAEQIVREGQARSKS